MRLLCSRVLLPCCLPCWGWRHRQAAPFVPSPGSAEGLQPAGHLDPAASESEDRAAEFPSFCSTPPLPWLVTLAALAEQDSCKWHGATELVSQWGAGGKAGLTGRFEHCWSVQGCALLFSRGLAC